MKECTKCGELKSLEEFGKNKNSKDAKRAECKECHNKHIRSYYHNSGGREKQGHKSMYENKSCSGYLGIVAAERLIKHLFNDVIMMPYGFPDYDMICNKGKRINVKASSIRNIKNKYSTVKNWQFMIKRNRKCDFFLCLAFDNVKDLNPLFAFLVPGNEVNHLQKITISYTTIHKWDKWKMDLDDAQACCDLMKGK